MHRSTGHLDRPCGRTVQNVRTCPCGGLLHPKSPHKPAPAVLEAQASACVCGGSERLAIPQEVGFVPGACPWKPDSAWSRDQCAGGDTFTKRKRPGPSAPGLQDGAGGRRDEGIAKFSLEHERKCKDRQGNSADGEAAASVAAGAGLQWGAWAWAWGAGTRCARPSPGRWTASRGQLV